MKGKNGVESKVEGKVIASQGDEFTMRAKLETGATLDWIFKFDRDGRLRTKEVKRVSFMRGRKQGYNTAGLSAFGEIDGDKVYWNSKWELRKKTLRQKYTLSKVN